MNKPAVRALQNSSCGGDLQRTPAAKGTLDILYRYAKDHTQLRRHLAAGMHVGTHHTQYYGDI